MKRFALVLAISCLPPIGSVRSGRQLLKFLLIRSQIAEASGEFVSRRSFWRGGQFQRTHLRPLTRHTTGHAYAASAAAAIWSSIATENLFTNRPQSVRMVIRAHRCGIDKEATSGRGQRLGHGDPVQSAKRSPHGIFGAQDGSFPTKGTEPLRSKPPLPSRGRDVPAGDRHDLGSRGNTFSSATATVN